MHVRGPKSGFRKTINVRRDLRKNLTAPEQRFWYYVARKKFQNLKFRQQHGIGPYIVDFYCPEKKLVIELDGDTHASDDAKHRDTERSNYLRSLGYIVVRYTNHDIMENIEGVFEDLAKQVSSL